MKPTLLDTAKTWPWHSLPPAARVDLTTLLGSPRSAMRTAHSLTSEDLHDLGVLVASAGWAVDGDTDYFVVARDPEHARRILEIDQAPGSHEYALGRELGYPICCCSAVDRIGEDRLDRYVAEITPKLVGTVLDLTRYLLGDGLISHVPCAPDCKPSKRMAFKSIPIREELRARLGLARTTRWVTTGATETSGGPGAA
jgi:hypothetical protein